jgi:hypothetical protein
MSYPLRARVRRLERMLDVQADRAEQMSAARALRLAMTPAELEARERRRLADAIAELSAPDRPGDVVQALLRRYATRRLQEAAA